MTKRGLVNLLSNEEQSLPEVWAWYEFQRALIGEEASRVFTALSSGLGVPASRYVGKTRDELERDFAYQLAELAQLTMLGMLACTEAALRVDFIERVDNRKGARRGSGSRRTFSTPGGTMPPRLPSGPALRTSRGR